MQLGFDERNAITFLSAAVRIPPSWRPALLTAEKLSVTWSPRAASDDESIAAESDGARAEEELWELQTHQKLTDHFRGKFGADSGLLSLEEVADKLSDAFRKEIRDTGVVGPLLLSQENRQRGMLHYYVLTWLDTPYFPAPKRDGVNPTSTVVAFKPIGLPGSPPWREYFLFTPGADREYAELAAVYDMLGLLAQRRSLISIGAQRQLCKIVLPWGRCRFWLRADKASRGYLLLPVITLLGQRETSQFRPTITMSVFLLPDADAEDSAPALGTDDLAALCQQAVWNDQNPPIPAFISARPGSSGEAKPAPSASDSTESLVRDPLVDEPAPETLLEAPVLHGPLFEGPLAEFIAGYLRRDERHLPIVFDAILRKVIDALGVRPGTHDPHQSVRMLVAISRARSIVFGSALHVESDDPQALWQLLTAEPSGPLKQHVSNLLSVNAARRGRESLVGGEGFRLDQMRVTNQYEEDTNAIVLYNPMSRFMVNIMPRRLERFPTISLKLGVAWLNLLSATVSSIKEILRSYRYEIEQYRNRIELLKSTEDPGTLLKDLHKATLTILKEIDVVYSFDLVTPTYKAAHSRVLEMEGISQERDSLMRDLETTTALLRSEEADQLSRQIANSSTQMSEANAKIAGNSTMMTEANNLIALNTTKMTAANAKIAQNTSSTDRLTVFVAAFGLLSLIAVADTLIDFGYRDWRSPTFLTMLIADTIAIVIATVISIRYLRRRTDLP